MTITVASSLDHYKVWLTIDSRQPFPLLFRCVCGQAWPCPQWLNEVITENVALKDALRYFVNARWDYDLKTGARFYPGGNRDVIQANIAQARGLLHKPTVPSGTVFCIYCEGKRDDADDFCPDCDTGHHWVMDALPTAHHK